MNNTQIALATFVIGITLYIVFVVIVVKRKQLKGGNMFKVGDRVKDSCGISGKIIDYRSDRDFTIQKDSGGRWICSASDWELEGVAMNQYDSLKARIANVTAWDKEADDILQEIGKGYALAIVCSDTSFPASILIRETKISPRIPNEKFITEDLAGFRYNSQCEKLTAFKKALMWLLDHSDIKKTIVGTTQKVEIEGKVYKAEIIKEV
jgi:hypothetical protein